MQGLLRGSQHGLRLGQDCLRLQQQGLDFGRADRRARAKRDAGCTCRGRVCLAGSGDGADSGREGGRDGLIVLQRRGQVFFELLQDVPGHLRNHAAAAAVLRHRARELELGGDRDVGAASGGGRQREVEFRLRGAASLGIKSRAFQPCNMLFLVGAHEFGLSVKGQLDRAQLDGNRAEILMLAAHFLQRGAGQAGQDAGDVEHQGPGLFQG